MEKENNTFEKVLSVIARQQENTFDIALNNIEGYLHKADFEGVELEYEVYSATHDSEGDFKAIRVYMTAEINSENTYTQRLLFRFMKESGIIEVDVADGLEDCYIQRFEFNEIEKATQDFIDGINYFLHLVEIENQ